MKTQVIQLLCFLVTNLTLVQGLVTFEVTDKTSLWEAFAASPGEDKIITVMNDFDVGGLTDESYVFAAGGTPNPSTITIQGNPTSAKKILLYTTVDSGQSPRFIQSYDNLISFKLKDLRFTRFFVGSSPGGALLSLHAVDSLEIDNCEIEAAIGPVYGAIFVKKASSSVRIINSFFYQCEAILYGQGNNGNGGAIAVLEAASVDIINTRFDFNAASTSGGSIFTTINGPTTIDKCVFIEPGTTDFGDLITPRNSEYIATTGPLRISCSSFSGNMLDSSISSLSQFNLVGVDSPDAVVVSSTCDDASLPYGRVCLLDVSVVEAKDLPDVGKWPNDGLWFADQTSDPFITVNSLGDPKTPNGQKFSCETNVVKNNVINPKFNKVCESTYYTGGRLIQTGEGSSLLDFVPSHTKSKNRFLDFSILDKNVIGSSVIVKGKFIPANGRHCDEIPAAGVCESVELASGDALIKFDYCFYPKDASKPSVQNRVTVAASTSAVVDPEEISKNWYDEIDATAFAVNSTIAFVLLVVGVVGTRKLIRSRSRNSDGNRSLKLSANPQQLSRAQVEQML